MRFMVRFAFLLGVLGALFWGDVVAFLKLSEDPKDPAPKRETVQQVPAVPVEPPAPRRDAREEARREFERLRRENLAAADDEARFRSAQNYTVDRESEVDRAREARSKSSSSSWRSGGVTTYTSPRPGWR
jgi:hypothetical protein